MTLADYEYYRTDVGVLYCGNCLEVLPLIEDKVDLVLADPPYNVKIKYENINDNKKHYKKWCNDWFCLLKAQMIIISCGIVNVGMWYKIKNPQWIISWLKLGCMGRSLLGFNNHEPLLFWGKVLKQSNDVIKAGILPDKQLNGHPCPKPLKWAEEIIGKYTKENHLILDPFLGSGTTAIACEKLGRRWIGIEISEKYCEIAKQRIKAEADQFKLEYK
ncbi:MAG: DNA-methyltransferase [Promethearchaeota archaeon]|jgi:DNA modification methylase